MKILYKLIAGLMIVGASKEKNDFVKTVLESLPHPFYVVDAKDYTIKLANSAACSKGFTDGTTCYALIHKTDKPCGTELLMCPLEEVKRTGKPAVAEHLHYDKNGNIRNMEVHCYPIFDGKGNVIQAIEYSLDITERKRSEEALADSEERYRNIIENSNDLVWSLDKNGNFTFINKQADKITGYRTSDFIGKSFIPLLNKDDIPRIMEIFHKTLSGKLSQYEVTIKRADGSDLTLSVNSTPYFSKGEISGAVSFGRDITQSKWATEALRESEEKYRSLVDNLGFGIALISPQMEILSLNAQMKKWFPDIDETKNPTCFTAFNTPPREETCSYCPTCKTFQDGGTHTSITETPMGDKVINYRVVSSPIKDKYGNIIAAIETVEDITEQKKSDDIKRENERLVLANRAKSEFLTVMSHELRTPLNAIIGFSELLKNKDFGELNEKQKRYADNVHSSGKHLLSLIDDILDITRIESGKMETNIEKVSVPKIINESADLIKEKAANKNIRIITQVRSDIEFIDTDANRLRQVLNNLLDNAVKFSQPDGGTITITALKEGKSAKFSVADTGIGIKKEDMGRLFRNFEPLDAGFTRKHEGTGLGLAISNKLVQLLGGTITAESKYGKGSTFTFYLPVAGEGGGMI